MAPPQGFAGIMDIMIALVLPDGNIADRRTVHAKWMPLASTPQRSGARQINPSEVNALLQRGNALKAIGDLAGARLLFGRAAEAGDARAAFSYAETYDPIVLQKLGEVGLASNVAIARTWYGKVGNRGSSEALERLERLAHWLTFPKAVAASP
jgi:TPR repeat protein